MFGVRAIVSPNMSKQFFSPFTMIVTGPSRSGKSTFITNLIKNLDSLVDGEKIEQVIWCYKNENSIPKDLKSHPIVTFHKGVPTDLAEIAPNTLIVFDDLMMDSFSKEITEIFTVLSHHNNISIILVLHNLFFQNKFTRNITLNTQYIVYFKNPRDLSSISHITRQLCPSNSRNLQTLFNEVTSEQFAYLIIDLVQDTPEILKYRSNIFNKEGHFNCFATEAIIEKSNKIVEKVDNETY